MDELDHRIRAVLAGANLPETDWAVARLREDVAFAAECARDTAALRLTKGDAIKLENAAKCILRLAREHSLEDPAQLQAVRRLLREARRRLLVTNQPAPRIWLWPCCINFVETWTELTDAPAGVYHDAFPSPALLFVTACCQLIDESVTTSAIMRAKRDYVEPPEMTDEEWAAFRQSELGRFLYQSDL